MTLSFPIVHQKPNRFILSWGKAIGELMELINHLFKIKRAGQRVTDVVEIYSLMDMVCSNRSAQRFIVVRTHNGDGKIRPGVELYGSIVYETYRHPLTPIKDQYQKFRVDVELLKILALMYSQKSIAVRTSDLPKSMIRTAYEAQNIKYAEMHFLHEDKKSLYYCTIVTTDENESFDNPIVREDINIAVSNIRNIFKK